MKRPRQMRSFDSGGDYNRIASASHAARARRPLREKTTRKGEVGMLHRKTNRDGRWDEKEKSNIAALLIALLALLIQIVCLILVILLLLDRGSEGVVGVISTGGEVKVDIVDAEDETLSLVGKTLAFRTAVHQEEVMFEPGATAQSQGFKIHNQSLVPVSCRVSVSAGDVADTTAFYEAFEVWISTDASRADARPLTNFVGQLDVGETSQDTYYLFVRMKPSAGNEWQGKTYTGIGVTVYAVQASMKNKE